LNYPEHKVNIQVQTFQILPSKSFDDSNKSNESNQS